MTKGNVITSKTGEVRTCPVCLEIRLDSLKDRDHLIRKLEDEDRLSLLADFDGHFDFYCKGKNIFTGKRERSSYLTEPLVWLYWLLAEQRVYTNPNTYNANAPEKYLKLKRGGNMCGFHESAESEELREWADGHVLANYLCEAPYVTFQSHGKKILEIVWDLRGNPVLSGKKGKANVSLPDFLHQVNKLGEEYAERLSKEYLQIKEKEFFKRFISYLGCP